ncbi:Protein FAM19A5 [Merluccius polli]|uniref:Protein FAM19A5 n=1 Tax=Merluccius polli TaxID=89951 RepID=A0AA47NWV6_MERPO|nr:Protein FAM19A5 [Merluccius polli]
MYVCVCLCAHNRHKQQHVAHNVVHHHLVSGLINAESHALCLPLSPLPLPPHPCPHPSPLPSGQLAVGTCEVVLLNRDSSVPRRTVARQTARCACRRGQIAGTTRARPACVDARIVRSRQWCEMAPCVEGEVCGLLLNRSGWTCARGSGRIKTVTVTTNHQPPVTTRHSSFLHMLIHMLTMLIPIVETDRT